ncbi:LacI family DNA-binding transcriptional regulator [Rariglobus hedericola]|uniref:LacI family transcriptional regulator n=1 Tax=Rariglobus hedericola TaxID=2597822 RepID=A0A556QP97_9BACT|nr:LacI family DNA-binding transcriptional regulator [Rariglobus hedericola]TSJ78422.1 LacI family transcriptional regulator [Rariglobus hedericola]
MSSLRPCYTGRRAVSLKDVAAELGVSYSLVSKVLSGRLGNTGVRPEVKEAIFKKAEEMNYRPHPLATALKQGRKGAVGVLVHPIGERGSELAHDVLEGLSSELDDHGLRMWLRFFETDADFTRQFDQRMRSEVDGLIVVGLPHPSIYDLLLELNRGGLPIVTAFEEKPIEGVPNVTENTERQCYLTTRHLLARGCSRIVHLKGTMPARYQGFLAAHKDAGISVDSRLLFDCNDYRIESGARAVGVLLDAGIGFDGIVAQSDHQALGAVHELIRRGKRVPEDVRVTGVDDSVLCTACMVPLTSTTSEMKRVGRETARLLFQRLEGIDCESVGIEPRLVIRASS